MLRRPEVLICGHNLCVYTFSNSLKICCSLFEFVLVCYGRQ